MSSTLDGCSQEPIHIPGAIQPHGVLIGLDDGNIVRCASANIAELGCGSPADALDRPFRAPSREASRETLDQLIERVRTDDVARSSMILTGVPAGWWNVNAHRCDGLSIVEFEPAFAPPDQTTQLMYGDVDNITQRLEAQTGIEDLGAVLTQEVRALTGMDRVMVYRFSADWHGEVIAESRAAGLAAFVGLHYPASDIPEQARRLYERNLIRVIVDVDYQPVPLVASAAHGRPVDLGVAQLRSVSPVHLEYLRNMGAAATLTVSLMVEGRLWGLIACHHGRPIRLDTRLRAKLLHLGRIASLVFASIQNRADADQASVLEQVRRNACNLLASEEAGLADLAERHGRLLASVAAADGVVYVRGDTVRHWGCVPPPDLVARIIERLCRRGGLAWRDNTYATSSLKRDWGEAYWSPEASGMLAARLGTDFSEGLLWFRLDLERTVRWGGDPHKPVETDGTRLSPRKSFVAWLEMVEGESAPWTRAEIESAGASLRLAEIDAIVATNNEVRLLKLAVQHASDSVLVTDAMRTHPRARIVYANPAFEQMTGYELSEVIGRTPRILEGPDTSRTAMDALCTAMARGEAAEGESVHYRKDREPFMLHWRAAPVRDLHGRVSHYVSILRDVTDERRAAEALKAQNEELDRRVAERTRELSDAVQELDSFAYTVSHDLRAPLRAIHGFATILATQSAELSSDEAADAVRRIVAGADRMGQLLDALLRFSRLSRRTLEIERIDMGAMVKAILGEMPVPPACTVHVGTLPDADGDSVLIRQVWQNLLSNAVKYSAGHARPRIEVGCRDGAYFVTDNGVGFDQMYVDKLFRVFSRLHTAGAFEGTGAGLAIVARIVSRHGGSVHAEGVEGAGATFTFTLPEAGAHAARA
jgi:PAS domain S-box-containing protein